MERRTRCSLFFLVFCLGGCASFGGSFVPALEDMPALEDHVRDNPEDVEALTRLGAAYEREGNRSRAASLLERAHRADSTDANATFFLGVTYEGLGRLEAAMVQYQSYLSLAPNSRFTRQVEGRVRVLRRRQLRDAIRKRIEESPDAFRSSDLETVAVFPFSFSGQDEQLRPLGRALAEMLATDLSQTDRLTVLERVQIQALFDELALIGGGLVDPATAVRGGRLLRAGRVVVGDVGGAANRLRLEAAVVEVRRGPTPTFVSQEDVVGRLFDLEKALAFQLYEQMGIPLTAAERQRVNHRFTENLQALLAFGRGLEATDAERYAEAEQHFSRALSLDPGFSEAIREASLARETSATSAELAEDLATALGNTQLIEQLEALSEEIAERDPVQEVMGTEGLDTSTSRTPVSIILRRPGGGA